MSVFTRGKTAEIICHFWEPPLS